MPNAFVRKIAAYGMLTPEETAMLVVASEHSRLIPPLHDLIAEGDEPSHLFIVLEGWACRYKVLPDGSRQITAFLMPGDFCDLHAGELSHMDHNIGTLTPCRVKTLVRHKAEALIISTPSLTKAFWRAQLIDEGVLRAWIVSLGRRNALERVAHLMLELYLRMRNIGLADDGICEMPLTQLVLADALGLTPIHLSRTVSKLKRERIMEIGSKTLRIQNIAGLVRAAGFDANYLHRRMTISTRLSVSVI